MRWITFSALTAALIGPVHAQQFGLIGPRFTPSSVRAEHFDTVFDVQVNALPRVAVVRNQTPEARFDAIVCNIDTTTQGGVQVNHKATLGHLDPDTCTMFANFETMYLGPVMNGSEWKARVYLRAKR